MTRLPLLIAMALLAAPATAVAADPVRLSPADAGSINLERVVGGTVYFTASADVDDPAYTLMRRTAAGDLQTIARRSHLLAEAAPDVGVVVETQDALVPEDTGGFDIYLIRPDGSPVLLTAGVPWNGVVGNGFGSLTPDRRGIVFTSSRDLNDESCTNSFNGSVCQLYGWRDGVLRTLDDGHSIHGFVPTGGFATDDFSQVFAAGGDFRNSAFTVPIAAFVRPDAGGTGRRDRILRAISADHRTAILAGIEDEHGLLRWTGDAAPTSIGPADPDTREAYLGGSPDLSRVFYAAVNSSSGTYDVYVHQHGTDTRLTPDPPSGQHGDSPSLEYDDTSSHARVSPDGAAIAFRTSEPLIGTDDDEAADVYVAGRAGLQLVSPRTSRSVGNLIGFTGTHVAFRTDEALTCADEDTATDVYVAQDGTVGLATPGTANDVVQAELAPDGDVVYVDVGQRHVLYKTTASTRCDPASPGGEGPAEGPGEAITVTLRGRAPRKCGHASCGKRSRVIVHSPAVGTVTVRIRRGKRSILLLSRTVGAGLTTVRLPYLPRAFKRGKHYELRVRVRPGGQAAVVRTLKVRVR